MRVTVVEVPERVVDADEARLARVFTDADADAYVEDLLEIAQSEIDGPAGWLNRAIGEQLLQVTLPACVVVKMECLPYPPVTEIVSDVLSEDGCTRVVQYWAGQPAEEIPKRIKHAIIMMAGMLRDAVPADEGALKSKTVDGVGRWDYSLPDGAAEAMKSAAERLLSTYRVYA